VGYPGILCIVLFERTLARRRPHQYSDGDRARFGDAGFVFSVGCRKNRQKARSSPFALLAMVTYFSIVRMAYPVRERRCCGPIRGAGDCGCRSVRIALFSSIQSGRTKSIPRLRHCQDVSSRRRGFRTSASRRGDGGADSHRLDHLYLADPRVGLVARSVSSHCVRSGHRSQRCPGNRLPDKADPAAINNPWWLDDSFVLVGLFTILRPHCAHLVELFPARCATAPCRCRITSATGGSAAFLPPRLCDGGRNRQYLLGLWYPLVVPDSTVVGVLWVSA